MKKQKTEALVFGSVLTQKCIEPHHAHPYISLDLIFQNKYNFQIL